MEHVVRGIGTTTPLPSHQIVIAPAVEGIVAEILVNEGDEVEAGRPLVRLDYRLAQRELAERKAAREELVSALTLLKTPPRKEEQRVADLEVERARVAEELAQTVLDRLTPLNRRKEVSDQQLFEAQQRLRDATLARQVAEGHRTVLMLGPKPEAVAEAETKIARAEAAVNSAETRLGFLTLKSPGAGLVDELLCHPGQLLAAGALAAEVLDTSEMFATIGVPPRDARLLRKGQPARVFVATRDDDEQSESEPIEGTVAFVGAEASAETGTVPVRVLVANPEGRLRLRTVVSVEIVVNVVPDALVVPASAIVELEEGTTIAIVHEGKAEILHPKLGLRQHGLVQVIAEDLHAGDLVITRGGYNLPEDTPVIVQPEHEGEDEKP